MKHCLKLSLSLLLALPALLSDMDTPLDAESALTQAAYTGNCLAVQKIIVANRECAWLLEPFAHFLSNAHLNPYINKHL